MFRQEEWIFSGASGAHYRFSIRTKKSGLPQAPGVVMLAYTHPRGHMAGWQVNPLFIGHADDMSRIPESEVDPHSKQMALWNSCFLLPESLAAAREACVLDLERANAPFIIIPE
ncbi:hypothetical protein [Pseudodesulfovibrio senegalensis]|uniref:Uncharacterized protein n=1 Tax=Pseudodesulfovibrio senegalensis TaxID=1721087 RepID=A0A6N6N5Q0_9BACT|nr:hypothetical protein [Pseudodesulfovibrio senegalensis]KAB1442809.1 hypothetical protein F8A88_00595 [Pseudodesulfovibrio senegalensis]